MKKSRKHLHTPQGDSGGFDANFDDFEKAASNTASPAPAPVNPAATATGGKIQVAKKPTPTLKAYNPGGGTAAGASTPEDPSKQSASTPSTVAATPTPVLLQPKIRTTATTKAGAKSGGGKAGAKSATSSNLSTKGSSEATSISNKNTTSTKGKAGASTNQCLPPPVIEFADVDAAPDLQSSNRGRVVNQNKPNANQNSMAKGYGNQLEDNLEDGKEELFFDLEAGQGGGMTPSGGYKNAYNYNLIFCV